MPSLHSDTLTVASPFLHQPPSPSTILARPSLELESFIPQTLPPRDADDPPLDHTRGHSPDRSPPLDEDDDEAHRLLDQDLADDTGAPFDHDSQSMPKKTRASKPRGSGQSPARPSLDSEQNGAASSTSSSMNYSIENRRKTTALDSSAEARTQHLIRQASFTLDDEPPPPTPSTNASIGFWDMSASDRRNFLVLVLLYFLQGIPMGLAGGSVPFLLKSHLSYGQIGVFSLASYPYSLKLLWSPIVDAVWSPKIGRRKSWILPIQMISGFSMIWLGGRVERMMVSAGEGDGSGVWNFTWWWFFLVFTCATQDIAVDGWAISLLSHKNISYASTAQSVGLTGGQFMSYTVFLAFNSKDFANKYFRSSDKDYGLVTLGGYLVFWGWAYIVVTIGLGILKREDKTKERDGIIEVYKVMGGILKLRNIQILMLIHVIAKLGFQANDAATNLKLLDKGFSQEDMALTVLIDFPFELALGYYAGKWSATYTPMRLWCWAFVGRLIAAAFAQFTVMIFPPGGTTTWYLLVVIFEHIFSTFMNTVMFVAVSAFHAKIADPAIGGTYMTMLATVSNLGGTFPRFFILKFIDFFTRATCHPPLKPPTLEFLDGASPVTASFSCVLEAEKHRCNAGGGTCTIETDGYYIMNVICIVIGVVTFYGFIRSKALMLQALPLRAWRQSGSA